MTLLRRTTRLAGTLCIAGAMCLAKTADARPWWMHGAAATNQNDFLPPDEAFRVSARIEGDVIHVRWVIADGYYLYRQKMELGAESPGLRVSAPTFPQGRIKTDPYLGTQEIYTQEVEGTAAFARSDAGAHPVEIRLTYQGCAEAGLCYPSINKVVFPRARDPGDSRKPGDSRDPRGPAARAAAGNGVGAESHAWEGCAILGGGLAFLLAGLWLRKGRRLTLPA